MESKTKVKCSKVRKCKWKGTYGEMVNMPVKHESLTMTNKCCPRCGHNEFYEE